MFSKNPDVIETDLGNELVLLDPGSKQMFSLNATGRALWLAMPLGTLDDAARVLSDAFEVDESVARGDANALLSDLVASNLVRTG